ncbi:uncharacterized protein [Drosophila pseudoobscura]|uniref:Uncharacterized protein isoform X2 n=1 Tax=Drosophila pseudoobscura pseudoobscura TaxID=46245 RepID=A0A6I8VWQ5_DROPS|nr:uncharacterized protein LOC26532986 isoform X2 [Drosophila pseudoobscura]
MEQSTLDNGNIAPCMGFRQRNKKRTTFRGWQRSPRNVSKNKGTTTERRKSATLGRRRWCRT